MARPKKENGRSKPMTLKLTEGQRKAMKEFGKAFGYGTMIGIIMKSISEYTRNQSER